MTKPSASRFLPLLLLLFAGSGCSALIYEIVWYQLLQLAVGATSVSMGVLLATFMGGLCLGSIGLPRFVSSRQHPLRVYAYLEIGIGVFGVLVLLSLPLVQRVYIAGAEHGMPGMLLRGFIAAVCMLPPTVLMGAALPAVVRWIQSTPEGVSWWGLLYGGNTAGAVFGCLLTGFYLLRIYNTATATYVAAAINLSVGLISFWLSAYLPARLGAVAIPAAQAAASTPSRWPVYVTIAISGATALGAEVVWTRLMGMLLGSTVYVFSIILAVFLIGLALGATAGSWLVEIVRPRLALGWCQILLTLGFAWTAYMIADSLPYLPITPLLAISPWHTVQLDLVRCLWAILPPAVLWGASFPLACAAIASEGAGPGTSLASQDSGRVVGGVYAANTFGAIVGALAVSLVLVPWIGTQNSQRVLLALTAAGALFMLVPYVVEYRSKPVAVLAAVSMLGAGLMVRGVDAIPGAVIAYGRRIAISAGNSKILYTAEGINSSVAISQWNDGAFEVDVNGHVEATTEPYDMKLQRMVGHLPGLLHPHPQSVLGIGFGAGVSAGTFTRYPGIEKITICEIEPVIPPTSTRYFGKQDYEVMNNPKTHIVYDDARHFVLTTTEKFDIIASDPLDVFVKGTAALYSKEYFEAVKRHLNPGGYFTLYVPLYETDEITFRSELATFFDAFPYGTVWANNRGGLGYDTVFMGQLEPLKVDLDAVEARFAQPDMEPVRQSLSDIGITSVIDLLSTWSGAAVDLKKWTRGAPLNTDDNLRLSYLAGWGINANMADDLYRRMLTYRKPPEGTILGSPEKLNRLSQAIMLYSGR